MIDNPLVSVIVPCYNVEKYIDDCVYSIIKQSYSNIEIILIDDGSTDSTLKKCNLWASLDSRVKCISQANGGLSAARNTGIKHITGDYCLCVDSDDYIDHSLIENCMKSIDRFSADMVFFGHINVNEQGVDIQSYRFPFLGYDNRSYIHCVLSGEVGSYAWSFVAASNLYCDIQFPVGKKAEDVATTYRIMDKANHIISISDCLYFYRQRKNSITDLNASSALLYYKDEYEAFCGMKLWAKDDDYYYQAILSNLFDHLLLHYWISIDMKDLNSISWLSNTLQYEINLRDRVPLSNKINIKLFLFQFGILKLLYLLKRYIF